MLPNDRIGVLVCAQRWNKKKEDFSSDDKQEAEVVWNAARFLLLYAALYE